MHPALLVAEILLDILDWLSDLPSSESRWTYAQLARCCRAWREYALDLLWMHLHGMDSVICVLRSHEDVVSVVDSGATIYWPCQIARISTRANGARCTATYCSVVFPHLESVLLFSQGCMAPPALATSTLLKHITLNMGFPSRMGSVSDLIERSDAAARFLHHARAQCPSIRSLTVWGRISPQLNAAIASYTQLRTISIHGTPFKIETFAAIATFPFLETLDLVAYLQEHEVRSWQGLSFSGEASFPALRNLTIRTFGPTVEPLLARIPVGVLTKLRLDMEVCMAGPSYMQDIFQLLAQKTSESLRELTVDDRTSMDDLPSSGIARWYNLELLSPLARLRQLRCFTLHHPDLGDADLEELARWWPTLEHLDLGTYTPDMVMPQWKAQFTPAAHPIAVRSFPRLLSATLPVAPP
ncbi:hypothetical protein K466DRAFT_541704 [Polyporus arcularius HHB13444]|uniref:F-box domain-containing protein n=1 Tax=Polyporus arcularius HHB13444 TaxID=1314778 RepID=A0A5C3PSV1_9APHY|nr:hypothetical protein K466DRAFT_541704 [Polyporus arcularius HHB13444]